MKRIYKFIIFIITLFFFVILYESLKAFDDGITGLTKRGGNTEGCTCHSLTPFPNVSVVISAPSIVQPYDTVECRLKITGGPLVAGGCDIAAGVGNLITSPSDTSLQRLLSSFNDYELTHRYPKFPSGDTIYWTFRYIAPNTPGVADTIFANGNSVNFNGLPTGDQWNYAVNKLIIISNPTNISGKMSSNENYILNQNYPNPFNPSTDIGYRILRNSFVILKVYDITGKEVTTLVNEYQKAGKYDIKFSAATNNLSSGTYFYRISFNNSINNFDRFSEVKKMTLIK